MGAGNHAQSSKFLWRIENSRGETGRHFRVETDFDASLDLCLAFDDSVKQVDGRYSRFTIVCEQSNQTGIPLVCYLGECGGAGRHQYLSDPVVELLNVVFGDL